MSGKPSKSTTKGIPPPEIAASNPPAYRGSTAGYDFYLQSICEIQKSIGSIESTIQNLKDRTQVQETKLDTVVNDVHGAKKLAWFFGILFSIIGAIGLVLLNKISDLAVSYFSVKISGH